MKPTPKLPTDGQDDLSTARGMPFDRKQYLVALIVIMVLAAALLVLVITTLPALLRASDPHSPVDIPQDQQPQEPDEPDESQQPEQQPEQQAPATPENLPLIGTGDTDATPTPKPTDTEVSTPTNPDETDNDRAESTPPAEPPVVVVEKILLSGSEGLRYRSYGNGTCVVEGIGSCTDTCLIIPTRSPDGDTVIAIAQEAFRDCDTLQAVQLPVTLRGIGESAFAGCTALVQLCIAADNPAFCTLDGILYSKDTSALLVYPLGRACPTAHLPASVRYISASAFGKGGSLQSILYEGSLTDWRTVTIGEDNAALYTLPKHFSGS